MPRLFVAIELPDALEAGLEKLRDESLDARWTRPGQHHLTLKFIGATPEERLPDILAALEPVQGTAFPVALEDVDAFPNSRRARVLVAGVRPEPELLRLQQSIEIALAQLGIEPEARSFRPHLTLARLKHADPQQVRAWVDEHASYRAGPFRVEQFHLYESKLHPRGATYVKLATYGLS